MPRSLQNRALTDADLPSSNPAIDSVIHRQLHSITQIPSPAIRGLAFGVITFFSIALCVCLVFLIKKKMANIRNNTWGLCLCGGGMVNNKDKKAPRRRFQREASKVFDVSLGSISMRDLAKVTNNFHHSNVIGDGGFGLVFHADLVDGRSVAIKKLSHEFGMQGSREFDAEIETLGQAKHPNLVELLAYCKLGEDRALVYEFVENGSLDTWLHERNDPCKVLDWNCRVKIIQGVARGLSYLHHECNPHILHRDIKSSNILLDNNFEPKISDFGMARYMSSFVSHVSTDVAGTMGYIAPEYVMTFRATKPADVYSFGVLMIELATGRRPNLCVRDKHFKTLASWTSHFVQAGEYMNVLDPLLKKQQPPLDEVGTYLTIACECVHQSPRERPKMKDVYDQVSLIGSTTSNV